MADQIDSAMSPDLPTDGSNAASHSDAGTHTTSENIRTMLDVHAPHQAIHKWRDFLVHIAAITIGLLIALGLEATVEWFHHKHQAQQALELLKKEVDSNRITLAHDMRSGDIAERNHREALATLHRLRLGTLKPDEQLIFVRAFEPLNSPAWKVVHESGAAAYLPYDLMARYGEIDDMQKTIDDAANSAYERLLGATSVLNTETVDSVRQAEDQAERGQFFRSQTLDPRSETAEIDVVARLSGKQDLTRLMPAQIDRLEQGFQQAISDDVHLHRLYLAMDAMYAAVAN